MGEMKKRWAARLRHWLIDAMQLPIVEDRTPPKRAEAREFLSSTEVQSISLSEFESRFHIRDVDRRTKIAGYPNSSYYRPEDPAKVAWSRKQTDAFLAKK